MRPAKDPFAAVPDDFKTTIDNASREDIKRRIGEVAIAQAELMEAQKNDEDYQRLKEEFKVAGEVYRDGTKENKAKIAYARSVLDAKGG